MKNGNLKLKTSFKLLAVVFTFSFLVFNLAATAPAVFAEDSRGVGKTPPGNIFSLTEENPLGTTSVIDLLNTILRSLTFVAIPIAVLMIIVGAFQMMSAGGDPEKFKTGRKTILYVAIGFAILLIARLLIGISAELLGAKPAILEEIRRTGQ